MSKFNAMHNRIVWVDVPVADLDRAIAFDEGNRLAIHAETDA